MAKYYTIAEVSEILSISKANLRYLETTIKKFRIKKIRGRRYYTESNIHQLRSKLEEKGFEVGQLELFKAKTPISSHPEGVEGNCQDLDCANEKTELEYVITAESHTSPPTPQNNETPQEVQLKKQPNLMIQRIEYLEEKFKALKERLKAAA